MSVWIPHIPEGADLLIKEEGRTCYSDLRYSGLSLLMSPFGVSEGKWAEKDLDEALVLLHYYFPGRLQQALNLLEETTPVLYKFAWLNPRFRRQDFSGHPVVPRGRHGSRTARRRMAAIGCGLGVVKDHLEVQQVTK
jgi:hypothetical protein